MCGLALCYFLSVYQKIHTHIMAPTTHKRPICWVKRNERRPSPVFNIGEISPPSMGPGVLTKLVNALDKPWTIDQGDFRPIMDYKKYLTMLEAQGAHPKEIIEKIRREHEQYYATHCHDPQIITNLAPRLPGLEHVESEINGCQAFIEFNKVKDPQDTIPMYIRAGVSQESIKFMEKRILHWKCGIAERNRGLDEILSKYSGKPQARKKKKSLRSRFTRKVTSIVKEEDLENDSDEGGECQDSTAE